MAEYHAVVIHEWTDFSVKLGGSEVHIIHASFQALEDPKKRVDVAGRFQDDLHKRGFVWLSTHSLPDPARGKWKRLLVIYRGDNEYKTSSAFWGATSAALMNLTAVATPSVAALALGSAILDMPVVDLLKIPALVVPLLSMSVTAYKWSRDSSCDSSVPLFLDNECVICLCDLGVSNAEILPCGHAFHYTCIQSWLALGGSCAICRQEPCCDSWIREADSALTGLFSHEF
ncbi:unnamed protein product, partial [Durusdinium trenchii]